MSGKAPKSLTVRMAKARRTIRLFPNTALLHTALICRDERALILAERTILD